MPLGFLRSVRRLQQDGKLPMVPRKVQPTIRNTRGLKQQSFGKFHSLAEDFLCFLRPAGVPQQTGEVDEPVMEVQPAVALVIRKFGSQFFLETSALRMAFSASCGRPVSLSKAAS